MTSSGGIKTRVHSLPRKEFRKRGGMFDLLEAVQEAKRTCGVVVVAWLWYGGGVEVAWHVAVWCGSCVVVVVW